MRLALLGPRQIQISIAWFEKNTGAVTFVAHSSGSCCSVATFAHPERGKKSAYDQHFDPWSLKDAGYRPHLLAGDSLRLEVSRSYEGVLSFREDLVGELLRAATRVVAPPGVALTEDELAERAATWFAARMA